ncbi:hypothetical protein VKT23_002794 [Stygiomarasmius scandens]|uniref:Uncharacterized protein n=1 Tax=Marasmiellus scandens TaxID=2682957 RepID=A0ABR1JV68_9AGAR
MIISNPHPIRADSFKSSRSSNLFNSKTVQSPPVIEIEHVQFDDTPFSHSFLEVFEYYFQDNASSTPAICETNSEEAVELKECRDMTAEISFNVEQITDLGSMWIDDEIDEIVVITPKTTNHTLPLSTIPEDTFHSPYSDLTITYEVKPYSSTVLV